MPPEQVVELQVVIRRMIVAVPPAPVAAFGNQDLLARFAERDGVHAAVAGAFECLAGLGQLAPGPPVVRVPDPDIEIRINPGPGKNRRQVAPPTRTAFGHGDGAQLRVTREAAVQGAQKWTAAAFEMLPRVLAI